MSRKTALKKSKRLQAIIGLIFLIPPLLGVIFFIISTVDSYTLHKFELSRNWIARDGGMSAAPIYLGLMALAGSYLIKDALQYLYKDDGDGEINADDISENID